MLGFNLDTSNIETELANCRAVYEKYYSELFTGAQDPRELVKTIDAELETAGWETIREEAQKQINFIRTTTGHFRLRRCPVAG